MKRLRSTDDLDELNSARTSSHRTSINYYYKPDNARKGLSSSSSRYDRSEDDRESSRLVRKRSDHDFEGFDSRRKGIDRYGRDFTDRSAAPAAPAGGTASPSPRNNYGGGDRIHRSESFCSPRRGFPKGFRSERDRSRREGSVSSWRRFSTNRELDDGGRSGSGSDVGKGSRDRGSLRSPRGFRDANLKSPSWSKESGSEQSKATRSPRVLREGNMKSPTWSKESGSEQSKVRSPKGLKDVKPKSPTWSKDSGSEQSKMMSSNGVRDTKSPAWSKDSGSEQSRSAEEKKNEELQVESNNTSEMEEGELEPEAGTDPSTDHGAEADPAAHADLRSDHEDAKLRHSDSVANATHEDVVKENTETPLESDRVNVNDHNDMEKEATLLHNCKNGSVSGTSGSKDATPTTEHLDCYHKDWFHGDTVSHEKEVRNNSKVEKPLPSGDQHKNGEGVNVEVKAEDVDLTVNEKKITDVNGSLKTSLGFLKDQLAQSHRDKGKSVVVTPSAADNAEDGLWVASESRDFLSFDKDGLGGPSSRGFELFSTSPVKKTAKTDEADCITNKNEILTLEPLDLSLSLPNVLLPIGSHDVIQAPGSPSRTMSVHSLTNTFCTNSDGFTASMSFTGSQSFMHNPSCSLTQNSVDYEKSVGSHPIFQGIDQIPQGSWQDQSANEAKHKEVPLYQRLLVNGNGSFHHSPSLPGMESSQNMQGNHEKVLEGNSRVPVELNRQLSLHRQFLQENDSRSASQSMGSRQTPSENSKDKKRAIKYKGSASLYRSSSLKEQERLLVDGPNFAEAIISRIVSEPMHSMARRFHEMAEQSLARLKESVYDLIMKSSKKGQLSAFQSTLQNRDINVDMLIKCHRSQLEILVALRTGVVDFLKRNNTVSTTDLAEIFLNMRCKNPSCGSHLPVDECDCKICSQKNGFCSACMCLICSKFDMATNTCSWVGCDVCLHWCHTGCALQNSYIRNGLSVNGADRTTEMQFHCVACNHPSEMFGFVKEVFQQFAKEWNAETLYRELEYVRRIFQASEDTRGRQMRDFSDQLLTRLSNKANLSEVYNQLMSFLAGGQLSNPSNIHALSAKVFPRKNPSEECNGICEPHQEPMWMNSGYSERVSQLETVATVLPYIDNKRIEDRTVDLEPDRIPRLEPVFDELESIVRVKQTEATMFQARANDARKEAEGLKRIAVAKSEKVEEEYTTRIAKLRLVEAEDLRKKKFEELEVVERAHREYLNMKARMEADIKDLLLKMEATRRNLAM